MTTKRLRFVARPSNGSGWLSTKAPNPVVVLTIENVFESLRIAISKNSVAGQRLTCHEVRRPFPMTTILRKMIAVWHKGAPSSTPIAVDRSETRLLNLVCVSVRAPLTPVNPVAIVLAEVMAKVAGEPTIRGISVAMQVPATDLYRFAIVTVCTAPGWFMIYPPPGEGG